MRNKTSVVILVFNDKNELALQLRAAHDEAYPLHWDFSAAGGVETGEQYDEAARRELKEELGIEGTLEFIGEDIYQDSDLRDKLIIYKTKHNGAFNPDNNEVADVRFFSQQNIRKMISLGEQFHPEFIYAWNKNIIYEK